MWSVWLRVAQFSSELVPKAARGQLIMGKAILAFFPDAGAGKPLRVKHVGMIGDNFIWQVSELVINCIKAFIGLEGCLRVASKGFPDANIPWSPNIPYPHDVPCGPHRLGSFCGNARPPPPSPPAWVVPGGGGPMS